MDQFDVIRQSVDVAVRVIANARADCWATAVAIGATYPKDGDPWLGHAVEQLCDQAQHAPDLGDPALVLVPEFDGRIDREGLDALTARLVELRALVPPAALGIVVAAAQSGAEQPLRFPLTPTATTSTAPPESRARHRAATLGLIAGVVIAALAGVSAIAAVWQSSDDNGVSSSPQSSAMSSTDASDVIGSLVPASTPKDSSAAAIATSSTDQTAAATSSTVLSTTTSAPASTTVATSSAAPTSVAPATTVPTNVVPASTTPATTTPAVTVPRVTTTTVAVPSGPNYTQIPYFWALATFTPAGAEAMTANAVDRSPAWAYGQHLRLGFEADPRVAGARTSLRQRADGSLEWCITATCRVLRDIVVTSDGKVESFTVDGSPLSRDVRSWAGDGPLLCVGGSAGCTEPTAIALRMGSVFSVGSSTFVDLEVTVGPGVPGVVRLGSVQAMAGGTVRPSRAVVAREASAGSRVVWLFRFDRFDALAPLQLDLSVAVNEVPEQWLFSDR